MPLEPLPTFPGDHLPAGPQRIGQMFRSPPVLRVTALVMRRLAPRKVLAAKIASGLSAARRRSTPRGIDAASAVLRLRTFSLTGPTSGSRSGSLRYHQLPRRAELE